MKKTAYSKMNLFIRSLIFSIYSLTTICLYSFVVVGLFFLPLYYRHALIRTYLRVYFIVLKAVCHIDYKVEGLEHIPTDRAGVV